MARSRKPTAPEAAAPAAAALLSHADVVAALRPDSGIIQVLRAIAAGQPVRGAREVIAAARTLLEFSTPRPVQKVALAAFQVEDPYAAARLIEVVPREDALPPPADPLPDAP